MNYKTTRSPSKISQLEWNNGFLSPVSHLFFCRNEFGFNWFYWKKRNQKTDLCYYVPLDPYLPPFLCFSNFISIRSNYSCGIKISKYSQSDINNQLPLTSPSRSCNILHWLDTVFLNFINKWNHRIKRAHNLFHKVLQRKCKNGV